MTIIILFLPKMIKIAFNINYQLIYVNLLIKISIII